MREGELIDCRTCYRMKKPVGRDAAPGTDYCTPYSEIIRLDGCKGYWDDPQPDTLWPGEQSSELIP